jgi:hypothetical protein
LDFFTHANTSTIIVLKRRTGVEGSGIGVIPPPSGPPGMAWMVTVAAVPQFVFLPPSFHVVPAKALPSVRVNKTIVHAA